MDIVKCINCGHDVEINIAKAVDEDGEEFRCDNCGFIFRYTKK